MMLSALEADNIVDVFDGWFKHYTEVSSQLAVMEENFKNLVAQKEALSKTNVRLQTECCMLQETVTQCQQQLHIVCHLQDEVQQLKQQIVEKEQALQSETDQHKAVIESIKEAHETEKALALTNIKAEYDRKFADLECQLQAEIDAKHSIQSHLENVKKDRDKELSRITMEYESKLTKAQKQKAQYLQQQQQVLNQDILRKKMQHMKENYEQEISTLTSQIHDMKHTIESVQHGKQVKGNCMEFSEQQPQKQLQELQKQPQRGNTSQHDVKGVSRHRTISGSKLKL